MRARGWDDAAWDAAAERRSPSAAGWRTASCPARGPGDDRPRSRPTPTGWPWARGGRSATSAATGSPSCSRRSAARSSPPVTGRRATRSASPTPPEPLVPPDPRGPPRACQGRRSVTGAIRSAATAHRRRLERREGRRRDDAAQVVRPSAVPCRYRRAVAGGVALVGTPAAGGRRGATGRGPRPPGRGRVPGPDGELRRLVRRRPPRPVRTTRRSRWRRPPRWPRRRSPRAWAPRASPSRRTRATVRSTSSTAAPSSSGCPRWSTPPPPRSSLDVLAADPDDVPRTYSSDPAAVDPLVSPTSAATSSASPCLPTTASSAPRRT